MGSLSGEAWKVAVGLLSGLLVPTRLVVVILGI